MNNFVNITLTIVFLSSILPNNSYGANNGYGVSVDSCKNYDKTKKSCPYKPSTAVTYATTNAIGGTGATGFPDFTGSGGDCTNFASSVIMAGLTGETDPNKVVTRAKYFSDKSPKWYFIWYGGHPRFDRGSAWTGANELYSFAKSPGSKGLIFKFITEDNSKTPLKFSSIQTGDIIFADWNDDGTVEHSMIVTEKTANTYKGTKVSYRNSTGYKPHLNRALSEFNTKGTIFHVYRPINYQD